MHWLNSNSGAIQALATAGLAVLTAVYASLVFKESRWAEAHVKEVAKGSRAQATIDVMMFLQAEYVRKARRTVRAMNPVEDWERGWSKKQKEAAGIVCSSFDAVAMLVENDLLDEEPFITTWAVTLAQCHEICKPYIESLRNDKSGPSFWRNFERAADKAREKVEVLAEAPAGG